MKLVLAFLAICFFQFGNTATIETRVVNGVDATRHEFPFIVNLKLDGAFTCGGSILNENWILTAAHCMNKAASSYTATAGDHDLKKAEGTEQVRQIARIVNHPQWNRLNLNGDYSLIKVAQPFNFTKGIVEPIKFPKKDWAIPQSSINARVAGWGRLYNNGPIPDILQKASLPLVGRNACRTKYQSMGLRVTDMMICAGGGRQTACNGDSGGPLTCQNEQGEWVLCGTVSFGMKCRENFPNVFSRTSSVEPWIRSTIST